MENLPGKLSRIPEGLPRTYLRRDLIFLPKIFGFISEMPRYFYVMASVNPRRYSSTI